MRRTVAAILLAGGALALLPSLGLPLVLRIVPLSRVPLDRARHVVEHPVRLLGLFLVRSRRVLRRRHVHDGDARARATTCRSCGRCRWPRLIAAVLGVALGAVVFRVKRVRGELFALATLAFTFVRRRRSSSIRRSTADPVSRSPASRCRSSGLSVPSTFYLLALALAVGDAAHRVSRSARAKLGTGLFAIHDDEDVAEVMGVPTFRYKLAAFAISCALAGVGRRHPRAVRVLRDGGRDVLDHRAAVRRADERPRRHAPLGGSCDRRHGDHGVAVRVHRGRSRARRQGGVRRRADRRDPVHAAKACSAGSRRAAHAAAVAPTPRRGRAALARTRATRDVGHDSRCSRSRRAQVVPRRAGVATA